MRECSVCKVSKVEYCFMATKDPRCVQCIGIASRRLIRPGKTRVPYRYVPTMKREGTDYLKPTLENWDRILKDLAEMADKVIGL